ncbi:ABC transporter ATP-binding protein [Aestuariivita sp.]|jgi:ABC-type nitrate/sulfonate/bicarbonate transport system ATPase subunit|uniref:ABC transporter ATP-binding protein n=1 Tax=Aestuariivita sp. TaxID=1872407 RepID=UPI002172ADFD|nr:ABC transporter ATP-binding protein [Aestuariivita sp.]MCE8007162.1 ABC transporter ATP-binding protein [Aestuariivita sp.]
MQIEPYECGTRCAPSEAKLAIEGVSKIYGAGAEAVVALTPMDLMVRDGDFLCVVGPSGCGKTTLLNLVAGFDTPTGGSIRLDGQEISGPGAERGVVFQQGALFNWMNVLENVAFGPRATGHSVAVAHERALRTLQMVGLEDFVQKYPYQLSGGMQQRVGIARALTNDPEVLLMDEPFAALDQQTREGLLGEIRDLWKRTGKTILWITHSIEEALFLATHIVVMSPRPGRVRAAFRSEFGTSEDPMVAVSPEFVAAKRQIIELLSAEAPKEVLAQ